jgi:hypothetical protein
VAKRRASARGFELKVKRFIERRSGAFSPAARGSGIFFLLSLKGEEIEAYDGAVYIVHP